MRGLELVTFAMHKLHGERNAPDLPVPTSAIERYAKRFGLSPAFCALVSGYDLAMMAVSNKAANADHAAMEKAAKRSGKRRGR